MDLKARGFTEFTREPYHYRTYSPISQCYCYLPSCLVLSLKTEKLCWLWKRKHIFELENGKIVLTLITKTWFWTWKRKNYFCFKNGNIVLNLKTDKNRFGSKNSLWYKKIKKEKRFFLVSRFKIEKTFLKAFQDFKIRFQNVQNAFWNNRFCPSLLSNKCSSQKPVSK